jgi:hypothetical protein
MDDIFGSLDRAMKKSLEFKMRGDFLAAVVEIDRLLEGLDDQRVRSEALAFRGTLRDDEGHLLDAKRDYREAHVISARLQYPRYTIELSLARVCERLGEVDEAATWYKHALRTAADGEEIAGGSALEGVLRIVGEANLTDEDRSLCRAVVQKSWSVLHLRIEPNVNDLLGSAQTIMKAATDPQPL